MANVESMSFDLTGLSLKESSASHRGWMSDEGVAHTVKYNDRPVSWTFDLTDPGAAHEFYTQQCQDFGGVMLSMEVTQTGGAEALKGLFKYRAPVPESLAMYFVGILWVPFEDCCFQINVEAMERGTTGFREALVLVMEPALWPEAPPEPPVAVESGDDLFNRMRSGSLRCLPSDDERFDGKFPAHPLSQVRARLAHVISTLTLHDELRTRLPFRIRMPWKN